MSEQAATALIAEDEPLLRQALVRQLAQAWPELVIVGQARNGREAVTLFESTQPDICFLDVHMPGLSGIEVARHIGRRAHLVFVTAYDQYAVQAFEQGVLDYLLKPVEMARLTDTVRRLRQRLLVAQPAADTTALLEQLAAMLGKPAAPVPLRWIHASVGQTLRLIPVESVDYLRADEKYTRVAWHSDDGMASEALVNTALKELLLQLDPAQFVQVHRAVVVNLRAVSHVTRTDNDTGLIHLKQRAETLPVSRSHLRRFRQM